MVNSWTVIRDEESEAAAEERGDYTTELQTLVTICAFAACAASMASLVRVPAERVAVPAERLT